jgi:uncharacterized protein
MINRILQPKIESWIDKKKIIIIYGARQVGKTTIARDIERKFGERALFLTCEKPSVRNLLATQDDEAIVSYFGGKDLVVIDEAQKVKDIGTTLKLLIDLHPEIQIIATGSSSFELSNSVNEPLTGRNAKFLLYPLSMKELSIQYSVPVLNDKLEKFLRFGLYPEIQEMTETEAMERLDFLSGDYSYRDTLSFEGIQRSDLLVKLLKALALQVGSEVSYRELAKLLDTTHNTVAKYIDLLEKSFIIYKLYSYSRNLRKELKNGFKVFFYDIGIRNSLIENFNRMESRGDVGGIWENFCINERMKKLQADGLRANMYFWRHIDTMKEIDLIEERDGKLYAFEFKWNPKASGNARLPLSFFEAYGQGENEGNVIFQVVDKGNWWQWLI